LERLPNKFRTLIEQSHPKGKTTMTEDQRRVARQRLDKQLRRLDSRKFSFNRFSMRKRMAYALLAFIYIVPLAITAALALDKVL
jgi:hypothetical protein